MNAIPSVGVLPMPNFTLTAFSSLVDVLRLAADEGDRSRPLRFRWQVITPGRSPVKASCGVEFQAWEALGDPSRFDYIVVCGGLLRRRHNEDEQIEAFLRQAGEAGVTVVGLCTGSFMMAQAGLLRRRKACVSWYHLAEFRAEFPDVEVTATDLFVIDGKRVTCAGGTGAADVGAWIVEQHAGAAVARKALNILLIDERRPSTAPQPQPPVAGGIIDDRLRKAVLLIEERQDRAMPVSELARATGVSRRQLERLFKEETGVSPAAFGAQMRLRYADWLLATSQKSVTEIALTCGFSDAAHFSRRYKAFFGRLASQARVKRDEFIVNERRPYLIQTSDAPR